MCFRVDRENIFKIELFENDEVIIIIIFTGNYHSNTDPK